MVALATKALDQVRRAAWNDMRRIDHQAARRFKGARWVLLKNPAKLTDDQAVTPRKLRRRGEPVFLGLLKSVPIASPKRRDERRAMTANVQGEVERVYQEQGERLWRAVFLYSRDREVASDAVSEAFAQALGRGQAVRSFEKWIWSTAFHVARGLLKERGRMNPLPPEPSYEMPQGSVDLVRALRSLSPAQRAVVVLHYYADYPIKEVAGLVGSSPAAVGVHLHRARRRVRTLLEERDG